MSELLMTWYNKAGTLLSRAAMRQLAVTTTRG